ncbi:MAG TPA: amino acid adenylation domain-containing protein, partial [Herpetosiphonaceae bacterium]
PPIGVPLPYVQGYVLNRWQQPVPIGVVGELYLGGAGLARGYVGQAAWTAERFVPDGLSGQAGARLYRTGDLVRWRADGQLEFIGRRDGQVQVRGIRIELGEIEAVLGQHPEVAEAVVVASETAPHNKRLIAFVVLEGIDDVTGDDLRSFVRERLPEYMVPGSIVVLEGMPLTPNGKLDRHALDALAQREHSETAYIGPRTPLEAQLVTIWQELLRPNTATPIGIYDNFFALGGHSLLATQVMSRLRDTFKVELPLRALFEAPTVADLAAAIQPSEQIAAGTATEEPRPARRDARIPLSFTQQRLWFLSQLQPDSAFYNIVIAIRIGGRLNCAALEQSLAAIVQRHEILRTTFQVVDGQPTQVISGIHLFRLPVQDLQTLPDAEREAQVTRLVEHEAQQPFNLAEGPLFRAALLRLRPEQHTLCLNMHHIVADGWSLGIFFRELSALYEIYSTTPPYAIAARLAAALPPLPTQYADYAIWQRQWLQGEVLERQRGYWRQQLAGAPPHIDLPTDRPRPAVQTFHGAERSVVLPATLVSALAALSQQEGTTLFMTLLAAFKIVLSRYTDQRDIVVGVPIANRNRSEIEGLIGCFVNTLVLRTDLSGNPTFRELLRRVRETALGAYAHQDLPFEKLVEELRPERDLSRTPLVQITFQLLNRASSTFELTGLDVRSTGAAINSAKFDLELQMIEQGGEIIAAAVYNTDLFDETTIVRLVQRLEIVLTAAVAHSERRLSDLPLLTDAERRQIVEGWNATAHDLPAQATIVEAFEAQVARAPDHIAVIYETTCLTFGDLNTRANRLAHHLRQLGVGPDVVVGLCVERSVDMLAGLLGILKAGGAYLPLDPSYPPDRLRFMLADSAAPVLVTHRRLSDDLALHADHIVRLDATPLECYPAVDPPPGTTSRNLAYVIYTSGSTGRPKGVQVEHRSVLNLLTGLRHTIYAACGEQRQRMRIGLNASLAFDSSVKQVIQLLDGHTLDVLPEALRRDNQAFVAYLRDHQIQVLDCTPTLLQTLRAAGLPHETALKLLLVGGEQIDRELWNALAEHPAPTAYNVYGPTECTVNATVCPIAEDSEPMIGRALANTRVYILDSRLNPVPVGVAGELYLGGPSVARGYRNRPDLTAERFLPDPFSGTPGARLYKTGDRARYRADGRIEFLGRLDQQVKLRGFRIELGEIEAVLREHPAVREALVIVRDDPARAGAAADRRLVAYVVGEQENKGTKEQRGEGLIPALRAYLKGQMPDHMLPSAFVLLDALPLLPNGKLDRNALPAPDGSRPDLDTGYVAPQSQLERVIGDVWQSILGVKQVGRHDNFFDLGGHSLLMVQVQGRLQAILDKDVPLVDMFRYATIKDLAHYLHQDQAPSFESSRDRAKTRRESLIHQRQLRHHQQASRRAQGVRDE